MLHRKPSLKKYFTTIKSYTIFYLLTQKLILKTILNVTNISPTIHIFKIYNSKQFINQKDYRHIWKL